MANNKRSTIASRGVSELDISTPPIGSSDEAVAPAVKAFNEFLELYIEPFVTLSKEIDPLVGDQAVNFEKAFKFQGILIKSAIKSKKPDFTNPTTVSLLKPLQDDVALINTFKDDNRRSKYYSQLNSIAEASGVLSWFLTETPISFIPDIKDSVIFWTNKVLKEFKDKDPKAQEWVNQFLGVFDGLKLYIKQYHSTGLSWNNSPNGLEFADVLKAEESKAKGSVSSTSSPPEPTPAPTPAPTTAPSTGGALPPPPPPPPPADLFDESKGGATSAPAGGLDAVFGQLNQGENITKGLKKVDKSQMTHKNPELRKEPPLSSSKKKSPPLKPKKPNSLSLKPKPEPVFELQDSKWVVKNIEDRHDIVINGDMSQSVFIANVKNSTIQVKGKLNAASVTETFKLGLVVDQLVSGIDILKSKKFGIQIVEKVPQITIDQSDEGQIYLSKDSLETEIYTTTTTSLNINVPDKDSKDGDLKEVAVPEQFKHTFNESGNMVSTVVEHVG